MTLTPAHRPTAVASEDLLRLVAGFLKAGIKRTWEILKHASGKEGRRSGERETVRGDPGDPQVK